ncbi:MAG: GPP34 family phosphoprotein [bacterium]
MGLYNYEKLMLLSIDDNKGHVIFSLSTTLPYGLAGAILFDLHFANRIDFVKDKVKLIDKTPIGDEVLDTALKLIADDEKHNEMQFWVEKLYQKIDNIKKRIINKLVDAKILKYEKDKILWFIPVEKYPTNNPIPEINLRLEIRGIVLDANKPTQDDIALISLIYSCNLVEEIFTKEEIRQAEEIIKDMVDSESVGQIIRDSIRNMMLAVTAASNAAVIATQVTT